MLKLTYTERFQKHYVKLTGEEKQQFRKKLSVFADNPLHPSLRTKQVIWFYEGDALVALVDIGYHGILKRY